MRYGLFLLLLFSSAAWAQPFTPDTGLWWNPEEGGRGFSIDVQDETVVVTVYVYTEETGAPVWYQGQGTLRGKRVEGTLSRFRGGQCIGCDYSEPVADEGFAGPFSIRFTSETTGRLTWQGGEIPIQRFVFAYADEWEKMLGEWQMVVDFTSHPANEDNFFYFADKLRFVRTEIVTRNDGSEQKQYLGFRVHSQFDRTTTGPGDAAGAYVPDEDRHLIVVRHSENQYILYSVNATTKTFSGFAEVYSDSPTFEGYPVEGVRTRTRSEVLVARKRAQAAPKAAAGGVRGGATPFKFPRARGPVSLEEVLGHPIDEAALRATVRRLEARLQ